MEIIQHLDFGKAFGELMPQLLQGFFVVIQAVIFGFSLALVVGLLIALGRTGSHKVLRGALCVVVEVIRGTPLLVQLVYIYFVVPLLFTLILNLCGVRGQANISALAAGIVGLGLNYGCLLSEVIRSGILNIDVGIKEAGASLGFTKFQVMQRLVLPQVLRDAVPVFGNYLITMIKDTSLLAYVSVAELLLRTQNYASQSFLTIESYTILAGSYLVISLPLSQVVKWLERRCSEARIRSRRCGKSREGGQNPGIRVKAESPRQRDAVSRR